MDFSEDDLQKMYATMSHPVRRRILHLLDKRGKVTFTDLMNDLDLSETGKISYHLVQMQPLITQDANKNYQLSDIGKLALSLESKAVEEFGVKKKTQENTYYQYWLMIILCGILGYLVQFFVWSSVPVRNLGLLHVGAVVSAISLGTILTYKLKTTEYKCAKAGIILGIFVAVLTTTLYGFWSFPEIWILVLVMILPAPLISLMASLASVSIFFTFFKTYPNVSEKKDDTLFKLSIMNPLFITIVCSFLLTICIVFIPISYIQADILQLWASILVWGIIIQILLMLVHKSRGF